MYTRTHLKFAMEAKNLAILLSSNKFLHNSRLARTNPASCRALLFSINCLDKMRKSSGYNFNTKTIPIQLIWEYIMRLEWNKRHVNYLLTLITCSITSFLCQRRRKDLLNIFIVTNFPVVSQQDDSKKRSMILLTFPARFYSIRRLLSALPSQVSLYEIH